MGGRKSLIKLVEFRIILMALMSSCYFSYRLKLKFSCMMELSNFPLDTQVCTMEIASCKYAFVCTQPRWAPPSENGRRTQTYWQSMESIKLPFKIYFQFRKLQRSWFCIGRMRAEWIFPAKWRCHNTKFSKWFQLSVRRLFISVSRLAWQTLMLVNHYRVSTAMDLPKKSFR